MSGTKQPEAIARVREQDREYCVATWQRTVFAVFRGEATLANIGTISKVCLAELTAGGGPVTYMGVIERSSPAPSELVRKELAKWSRDIVPRMACAVMVAEGGGFKNALVRGVGVALTVLAPHKVPFKFASTVEEAAGLLDRHLATGSGGAAELMRVIAEVRARWQPS